jgi:CubicO group peptidase (beta-lactamase class C family)
MKTISYLFLGLFSCQSFTQGPLSPKGYTAAGFESLRQIFQENFTQYGEEGAALVVYHQGEKIVDLQGGSDGYGAPFTSQSDGLWFSATKGIASLALARLHSQGLLDYDQRVAYYWPDFAQGGKENITVRQLLSHQAGVVLLPFPLKQEDLFPIAPPRGSIINRRAPLGSRSKARISCRNNRPLHERFTPPD